MEFKELIAKRRSVRKFTDREVPREVVDRILAEALSAPSARNTRTTRFLVVDDPALVARMAEMRDYGSAFLKGAPLAVLVLGDTSASDLWRDCLLYPSVAAAEEGRGEIGGAPVIFKKKERGTTEQEGCNKTRMRE